ncbi:MAG: hypothetical protein JJE21_11020, partial [Spirochaetaceae bacterium]|nr:hypothetical protein [Spirochaetaceae bacterium]
MSKRRKKGVTNNTKETAGDSRFSVLTDEKDTYSPFKGLSVDDVVVKKKTPSPNNNLRGNKTPKTPQNNQPKKIVETFDNDVSFSDIFSSWENGRSLDNVKKKIQSNNSSKPKVIEEEDFASVFSQWEKSQGIAPKEKKTPPNKSKQYKPRKDFGSLLDEFEGNPNQSNKIITPNINQILKRTDVDSDESSNKAKDNNQKQQPKESTKNTELPNNYRVIAESGSNNLHKTNKIDYKDLNKGKNINTKIQTKLSNEVATKVVEAKAVEAKAVEAKAVEAKAVDAK